MVKTADENLRKSTGASATDKAGIKLDEKRERNPASERKALIRFLAYLKPYLPLSTLATLCGICNYMIGTLTPSITGYMIDRFLSTKSAAPMHGHPARTNPLYP